MERVNISKHIEIAASPETVFDAVAIPEQIVAHYPVQRVESDLREGGKVNYHGEHNGASFTDYGIIDLFDRGRVYKYTYWSDNHGTERLPENHMSISYRMTPIAIGTALDVLHENTMKGEYSDVVDGLWDVVLGQLKDYAEKHSRKA